MTTAIVIPGSNHAIIKGKSSRDTHRQQRYIDTVIKNLTDNADTLNTGPIPSVHCDPTKITSATPPSSLKKEPCCFVADTDSEIYVVDTAANQIGIKDAKMMTNIRLANITIKSIGGAATVIKGVGTVVIKLESDDGRIDNITVHNAVYVPTSP